MGIGPISVRRPNRISMASSLSAGGPGFARVSNAASHTPIASSREGCTAPQSLDQKSTRECRSLFFGLSPKMRPEVDEKLAPALCALTPPALEAIATGGCVRHPTPTPGKRWSVRGG